MITSVTSCDCDLQRGTRGLRLLSHADATQTGWPQRIAAFPLRPISLSLSLLPNSAILAQDNLFRSQTVMFILFFFLNGTQTLLSVIYGDTELQQVKDGFASVPGKRRLTVCLSSLSRFDVALLP